MDKPVDPWKDLNKGAKVNDLLDGSCIDLAYLGLLRHILDPGRHCLADLAIGCKNRNLSGILHIDFYSEFSGHALDNFPARADDVTNSVWIYLQAENFRRMFRHFCPGL